MRLSVRFSIAIIAAGLLGPRLFAEDDLELNVRNFILDSIKDGKKQTQIPGPLGKVYVVSGDADGIEVEQLAGGRMPLKWKQLKPRELYSLARNMLKEGDVDGHLAVARYSVKADAIEEMDRTLEKLELAKPTSYSRIERVRVEIVESKARPATPAPVPVTAAPDKAGAPSGEGDKEKAKASGALAAAGLGSGAPASGGSPGMNHAGRALPPLPKFDKPVLFNTPEADAIVSAMQIFPATNPWNEDISKKPVHPDSDAIVASIGAEKHVHVNRDMNFVLVPPTQARQDLISLEYKGESDKGPYPIADNMPIEGWPGYYGKTAPALDDVQRNGDGDRHAIAVDPFNGQLWEFFYARRVDKGWQAAGVAMFNLRSNKTRPDQWTSADAAGLPIFPSIVRFDECERGMVEHALRFTVRRTRKAYIWPATHYASTNTSPTVPAMGQRFRLKASVDISKLPKHAQAVALALKKYGMFVADNGSDWFLSTSSDPRLKDLEALHFLKGKDFEVVETTPRDQVLGSK